jgi:hypothetical protein
MTKHVNHTAATKKPSVIVFGLDADEKPRAGVFTGKQIEGVRQAAGQLRLRIVDGASADGQTLATRVAAGRIQDDGQPVLPYVARDLYDQIVTIADAAEIMNIPATTEAGGSKTAPGLPATWDDVAIGHLVIAQDDYAEDGWWEATVLNRTNDILTLRWRDFPRYKPFTRHVGAIALLNPARK